MENTKKGHFLNFKIVAIVALIMAAVMFTGTPLGAIVRAEGPGAGKYIKRTVYVVAASKEEAVKAIKDEKLVLMDTALYEGRQKTFLAYETTDNGAEAITDIKAMNMKGGWSYKEYQDYVDTLKNDTKKAVSMIMVALKEFREEYKKDKNKKNVKIAYEMLNRIKDTDLKENNGLADIMLDESFTEEKFNEYYLQGNTKLVTIIELALLIGCSYTTEKSFIENLNGFEFTFDYDTGDYAEYSKTFSEQLITIKRSIELYKESPLFGNGNVTEQQMLEYIDSITDDEGFDPNYDDNGYLLSKEQKQLMFTNGVSMYLISKDIAYKTEKDSRVSTLLDFFTSDVEQYATEDFYPILSGMSKGQLALLSIGLDQHFDYANQTLDELEANYAKYLEDAEVTNDTEFDLYFDVNRRIYNPKGIAMTSDVIREAAVGKTDWAKVPNENLPYQIEEHKKAIKSLSIGIASTTGFTMFATVMTIVAKMFSSNPMSFAMAFCSAESCAGPFGIIAALIIAIPCIILLIQEIVLMNKEKQTLVNKWEDIPQIICSKEQKNGKTRYVYYDAISDIKDGNPLDVGLKESGLPERQWVALYTTTDNRIGKPILTSSLNTGAASTDLKGKTVVTVFGGNAALDLNKYNEYGNSVYMSFTGDDKYVKSGSATKASSIFSKASSWGFAAAGLALGLVGGALIGTAVKRKKQETPEQ